MDCLFHFFPIFVYSMVIKTARRDSETMERSGFYKLHGDPSNSNSMCIFWLKGRCHRNPCRFAHGEMPHKTTSPSFAKQSHALPADHPRKRPYYQTSKYTLVLRNGGRVLGSNVAEMLPENLHKKSPKSVPRKSPEKVIKKYSENVHKESPKDDFENSLGNVVEKSLSKTAVEKSSQNDPKKSLERVCQFWAEGNCIYGDQCHNLHSWFRGDGFMMLAKLQGHEKAVTGIVLPERSNKLYSGSSDGTVRLWDCHSGQCASVINLGGEVRSIICEGPLVFVGMLNVVKVWNTDSAAGCCLNGPTGQVNALEVVKDLLFAGAEDGVIYTWKGCYEANLTLQLAATLKGHTLGVTSLVVGGKSLYSGSLDHTIRVWDHETLQCIMTLNNHNDVVTSFLCWDQYLFSSSLDCTVKVWAATEEGSLEVVYTHNEEHGVLALNGMTDTDDKPIIYCSCADNSVHLYELPSFVDRGRLFANEEVGTVQIGPGGLFFTGDRTGLLTVWKWPPAPRVAATGS
ncbi:zinc finger CCCH domain-containing protein 48-like isoform X1 [Carya illinoinensis]|uniref:C3H1-type domain-containing protein n=3 Tax=Carya illinoinensis TaxID=32201 RepID=A0A922K5U7_CARIL|nr:zinc finger CCCH domain-containing protein 48-like isoform X1 [Carya illinoinensis]KAG6733326.1 hypothetical protein I3842_01G221100 [Carya illinoinensis]